MNTRIPTCPKCGGPVTKVLFYGAASYSCLVEGNARLGCGTIGPWKERSSIRNPAAGPQRRRFRCDKTP